MEKSKKTAIINGLGIAAVIGVATVIVALGILKGWLLAVAAAGCYPMAKNLWNAIGSIRRNPVRILQKSLPKTDFTILKSEWNEAHTACTFYGNLEHNNFIIDASCDNPFVEIYQVPWMRIEDTLPEIPKILETINEINSRNPNMCVFMGKPNDEGMRLVMTKCRTILPSYLPDQYLTYILCEMLARKVTVSVLINNNVPRNSQSGGPIGFQPPEPGADSQESGGANPDGQQVKD